MLIVAVVVNVVAVVVVVPFIHLKFMLLCWCHSTYLSVIEYWRDIGTVCLDSLTNQLTLIF